MWFTAGNFAARGWCPACREVYRGGGLKWKGGEFGQTIDVHNFTCGNLFSKKRSEHQFRNIKEWPDFLGHKQENSQAGRKNQLETCKQGF